MRLFDFDHYDTNYTSENDNVFISLEMEGTSFLLLIECKTWERNESEVENVSTSKMLYVYMKSIGERGKTV